MKKNFYVLLNNGDPIRFFKLTLEEYFVMSDLLSEVETKDYELCPIDDVEYTEIKGERK